MQKLYLTTIALLIPLGAAQVLSAQSIPASARIPANMRIPSGATTVSSSCTPVTGYLHCRTLTVDHTQVGGSTLTNFAVLVQATLGASRIQNVNGFDVVFTSDAGGTTLIPWEMESVNQSTGAIVAWVLGASVSSSVNTVLYVSYDNVSITTAQNTGGLAPANVWDASYAGVWHLANPSSLVDSTSNNITTTNNGTTATAGEINGGVAGNGTSEYVSMAGAAGLNLNRSFTISGWVNRSSAISGSEAVVSANTNSWYLGTFTDHFRFLKSQVADLGSNTTGLTTGTWYYIVVTIGAGTPFTGTFYLNGSPDGTFSSSVTFSQFGAETIGADVGGISDWYTGTEDEIRVSNVVRSAGQITAEYNNQVSGSTFVAVGGEV